MATFTFRDTVPVGVRLTALLGVDKNNKFADADAGKAVKLGTSHNYVPVAAGDDIEGFCDSIQPETQGGGFSYGGVQIDGWRQAQVGANQGGTPMAVGDYVVADTPVALGTAGMAKVKTGAAFAQSGTTPFAVTLPTPKKFFWRVYEIVTGTGVAGDTVLLLRV